MWKAGLLSLAACTSDAGTEDALVYDDGPDECTPVDTLISSDDASALGFSADEVSAHVTGTWTEMATFHPSGLDVGITFAATPNDEPVVLRTWDAPDGGSQSCALSTVMFSMDASIESDDGAIVEAWRQVIDVSDDHGFVTFLLERDVAELSGSLDAAGYDQLTIWNTVNPGSEWGDIYGNANLVARGTYSYTASASSVEGGAGRCVALWNLEDDDCTD